MYHPQQLENFVTLRIFLHVLVQASWDVVRPMLFTQLSNQPEFHHPLQTASYQSVNSDYWQGFIKSCLVNFLQLQHDLLESIEETLLSSKLPSHTEVLSLQEKFHWKHSRNLRLKVTHEAFANFLQPRLVVLAQNRLIKF